MARRRLLNRTTVIAVTGSSGKTSATHFLGKILSDHAPTYVGIHKNCQLAVLKSISRAKRSHRYLLQEAGIGAPGGMSKITPLLKPHIGIVTTIGRDHHTKFRTLEATAAEKGVLVESLSESGTAVLNADDPHVLAMAGRTRARLVTYGRSDEADLRAVDVRSVWPERLSLTVTFQGESCRIETALFGDLLVPSVLAAVAGGLAAGIDLKRCARSLANIAPFPHRLSVHRTPQGAWFIDDSFKASFWGVGKVVSLLRDVTAPRKTVVFGSFSDTPGADSRKYRAMARLGLEVADRVIFVGKKAEAVKKMLSDDVRGRLFASDSVRQASRLLGEDVVAGELVLVKSNIQEHLERLMYGQSAECSCWKETCPKKFGCEECAASGVVGSLSCSPRRRPGSGGTCP
jgi:UDP-N-acetylmuramoyl-tripeptide--D-alanyl-D-alanine ligase